jgi:hypothetical protein
MTTPCITDPYKALACYALHRHREDVSSEEVREAENFTLKLKFQGPPLLQKFLAFYPPQDPMWETPEEIEGLLQCIWRGDFERTLSAKTGPYTHFKGGLYLCYGKSLLIQGLKEETAVVYSNQEGSIFVRPLREWAEIVKWEDNRYRPRFVTWEDPNHLKYPNRSSNTPL